MRVYGNVLLVTFIGFHLLVGAGAVPAKAGDETDLYPVENFDPQLEYTDGFIALPENGTCPDPVEMPDYSYGFESNDFYIHNIYIDGDGRIVLGTWDNVLDPNNIVSPWEMEISVNFLYENMDDNQIDMGWMLPSQGMNGSKYEIYTDINDNNNNGVLDDREEEDRNGDDRVNVLDNQVTLGTFAAGTEIVFYLKNDNTGEIYYTKESWNPDFLNLTNSLCNVGLSEFDKIFLLDESHLPTDCQLSEGWLDATGIERIEDYLGITLAGTRTIQLEKDQKFPHVMVGAPPMVPYKKILGWEASDGANTDLDYNDIVFQITAKVGGEVQLKDPIVPDDPDAFFTAVEFGVFDYMPEGSEIRYAVSSDNGGNWIYLNNANWEQVHRSNSNGDILEELTDWYPGSEPYTYREARVDLVGMGLLGRELLWKAELIATKDDQAPMILRANNYHTSTFHPGTFSRSTPTVLSNVLYSAHYAEPDPMSGESRMRGYLEAVRIYDPANPERTDEQPLWNAGEQLAAMEPDSRNIYYHDIHTASESLQAFIPDNLDNAALALNGDTIIGPGGVSRYIHDFNGDDAFTEADGDYLVNWVRGYRDGDHIPKHWPLGAIDHSRPAVLTPPGVPDWYYRVSPELRQGYDAFREAQADRRSLVFAGARDGMLHAFDAGAFRWGDNPKTDVRETRGYFQWSGNSSDTADYGTGEELWAFIPGTLLPRLKNNQMGETDQAHLDGSPVVAEVFINEQWRSVLISGQGNGGDTVFCLDVTDPLSPRFMWEFADPDLYRCRSIPRIGRLANGKWAAFFFSSKTHSDAFPSLFVVDIADGSLIHQVWLNTPLGDMSKGGVLSEAPALVDSDENGDVDRLYVGSDQGYLYKVNFLADGSYQSCIINSVDANTPIIGAPKAMVKSKIKADGSVDYLVWLYYATGDSPYADEGISDTQAAVYAYQDMTDGPGGCTAQEPAWHHDLPADERVWHAPALAGGKLYFSTAAGESEAPCGGWIVGSLYRFDGESGALEVTGEGTNPSVSPVVYDQHLYLKDRSGALHSLGAGSYNNPTKQGILIVPWKSFIIDGNGFDFGQLQIGQSRPYCFDLRIPEGISGPLSIDITGSNADLFAHTIDRIKYGMDGRISGFSVCVTVQAAQDRGLKTARLNIQVGESRSSFDLRAEVTHACDCDQYTVTQEADDGSGSLRQALKTVCPGGTIVLESDVTLSSGPLVVDRALTIQADPLDYSAGNRTIARAADAPEFGLFKIQPGADLTLAELSLINGHAPAGFGGAVFNDSGSFTAKRCTFYDNQAGSGGAVYNLTGDIRLENCTLSQNQSRENGGAVCNARRYGSLEMDFCTVFANLASKDGGGIFNQGAATVKNTIVVGNQAGDQGADLFGDFTGDRYNLIGAVAESSGFGGTDKIGLSWDTVLERSPQNNGGGVLTHALIPGSPAINGADPAVVVVEDHPPWFDNRGYGFSRLRYDRADIGAFEYARPISGDLNGSGTVDMADAVIALQVMAGIQVRGIHLESCLETLPASPQVGFDELFYILDSVSGKRK